MLYAYTLNFDNPENVFWEERIVHGDARSCGSWEMCFPHKLDAKNLNDFANAEWTIPDRDGEEIFRNYDGLEIRQQAE